MSITSIAPSTTASLTATSVTSLLALTTPFVQPPECTSIWSLSSDTLWFHGVHTTLTILSSDQADPRFTSCQPSGWDRVPAANRFTFSPAVCPRGWVYHHMAATESGVENRTADTSRYSTYSTAYCCASGYSRWHDYFITAMTNLCVRSVNNTEITIKPTYSSSSSSPHHRPAPTHLFTEGLQAHDAWKISWEESDTSTLAIALPELTSTMVVQTWTPGQTIPRDKDDQVPERQNDMPGWDKVFYFCVIGAPLIGLSMIGCCVACCVSNRWAKRRKKQARELAEQQGQEEGQQGQQGQQQQQQGDDGKATQ